MAEIRIAFRNLLRHPFLNFIKVIGLSLALSGGVSILLFIRNQLSYDTFHRNHDRIYRLTTTGSNNFEGKHFAKVFDPVFVPKMASYFPEVETYVRLVPVLGGVVKFNDQFIKVEQGYQCDSTFFRVFDCNFRIGNPDKVFNSPGSMVVTESFAKKVFGRTDQIGQIITIPEGQYYGARTDFIVNAVIEDFPQNSHFHPEFIVTPVDKAELGRVAWTYLLLHPHTDTRGIIKGFETFYRNHVNKDPANLQHAYLERMTDIHLHSDKLREIETNGSMSVIFTLAVAGALLLMIAILNFINLKLGMVIYSDKFLNISKVLGSGRFFILRFFIYDGLLTMILAGATTLIILSGINSFIIREFSLSLFDQQWFMIIGVVILSGAVVVLLAALVLQKENAQRYKVGTLKLTNPIRNRRLGNALIVIQNMIAISMIAAVIVIHQQTEFALANGMGTGRNNLICFENVHSEVQQKFETFKAELLKSSSIQSVSAMLDRPGGEANDMMPFTMQDYRPNSENQNPVIGVLPCDFSIAQTFGLTFLSGKDFSFTNKDNEGSAEYIVNESALRFLNHTDPQTIIGKEFDISFDPSIQIPKGHIIGVVKDFHVSNLRRRVGPLVLFKRHDLWLLNFIVAFRAGAERQALDHTKQVWKKMFPGHAFQYEYVDRMYRNVYKTEELQKKLLSVFTVVALFISAMGLLGLCLLTTQQRLKELAIRKVTGALSRDLFSLLSWGFIKWVLVAFILAVPISYYGMTVWLEAFAYKIELSWTVFAIAGCTALAVAYGAIAFQSLKASHINPVQILKHE